MDKYVVHINMWSMKSASGRASLSYCNGAFSYSQKLADIIVEDSSRYVVGYPEVWVGRKPWFLFNTPGSPLPMKAYKLMSSVVLVYAVGASGSGLCLEEYGDQMGAY